MSGLAPPLPAPPIPRLPRRTWANDPRKRERLLGVLTPFVILALWEACARMGLFDTRFFPPPSIIALAFADMIRDGTLGGELAVSARRLAYGLIGGTIPGVVVGLAMGMSATIRAVVDPIISALMPVPKTVIVPLSMLIFGVGETSDIVMVAIGVFFPMAINAYAGVAGVPPIYFDVARSLRVSRLTVFTSIAWPGALATMFAGFQLAVANGLIILTVVEMLGATEGLGHMIWSSWQVFEVPRMYVGIIVISAAGVVIQLVMKEVKRVLLRWDPAA